MDYFDVVKARRSVRAFSQKPVEEEKLQAILKAANDSPSAGNLQAYEIYVARESSHRKVLAQASHGQDFVAQAPVVLIFCAHPALAHRYGSRGEDLYSPQDATIACTFAMLAATALGLATVWVGSFDDEAVHRAIGSPKGLSPIAILPIGHPAEEPPRKPRRKLSDLVHELKQ